MPIAIRLLGNSLEGISPDRITLSGANVLGNMNRERFEHLIYFIVVNYFQHGRYSQTTWTFSKICYRNF